MANLSVDLPSGKSVDIDGVPDGATQDEIKAEIIRQGLAAEADFSPPSIDYKPNITPLAKIPAGISTYTADPGAVALVNKMTEQRNEYEKSINTEERLRLKELESERPFLSGVVEGFDHTLKDFEAGLNVAPDWLPETLQKIWEFQPGLGFGKQPTHAERKKQIDDEMAKLNERYQITRMENPVSTMVGETVPFLGTGVAGEKFLLGLGKKLEAPLQRYNIKANRKIGNELEAKHLENKEKRKMSEYSEAMGTVLRGSAIGGAEGSIQHSNDALSGAGTAAMGGFSGMFGPMKMLNKVRNERDAGGKALIDEMYGQGFTITPGMRTANRRLLKEEQGLRNNDNVSQEFYNAVDEPNQRRMTTMAGEAIGLDMKGRDVMTQKELSDHMDSLSSQYKDIEAKTQGFYNKSDMQEVGKLLRDMKPTKYRNTSPEAKANYNTALGYARQMQNELGSTKRVNGVTRTGQPFSGKQYQDFRSALQREIDDASSSTTRGSKILADKLKEMQKVLDKSITKGMGEAKAAEWKDLNERYAMTRLLLDKGMTASGRIDPTKVGSFAMSKDEALRTLTGQGGRIKKFQDIARYNDALHGKHNPGSDLTGFDVPDHGPKPGLFSRAANLATKPIDLLGLGYRTNTLTTPFIGKRLSPAHGLSPTSSIQLQRAIMQTQTPQDYVQDQYEELMRALKE